VRERSAKIFTVVGNGKGKSGKVRVEWESGGGRYTVKKMDRIPLFFLPNL
jgi:hypothetical protein